MTRVLTVLVVFLLIAACSSPEGIDNASDTIADEKATEDMGDTELEESTPEEEAAQGFEQKLAQLKQLLASDETTEYNVLFQGTFGMVHHEEDEWFDFNPYEALMNEDVVFHGEAAVSSDILGGKITLSHSNLEFDEAMPFAMLSNYFFSGIFVEDQAYLNHRRTMLEVDYPDFAEEFHYFFPSDAPSVHIYWLDSGRSDDPIFIPKVIHPLRLDVLKKALYEYGIERELVKEHGENQLKYGLAIVGDRLPLTAGEVEMGEDVKALFDHLAEAISATMEDVEFIPELEEELARTILWDTGIMDLEAVEVIVSFDDNGVKTENWTLKIADTRVGSSSGDTLVYQMETIYENMKPVSFTSSLNKGVNTLDSNVFYWELAGEFHAYESVIDSNALIENMEAENGEVFTLLEPILRFYDMVVQLEMEEN